MTTPMTTPMTTDVAHSQLQEQVFEAVIAAVRVVFEDDTADRLTLDTTFEEMGATSLEVATVAFELEDAFDVEILNQELADFRSLREARDIVVALIEARSAA